MEIQARMYRENLNLGFGLAGDNGNGGFDNLFFNQKQQQQQQQQQQRDLQFQMLQIQNQSQNQNNQRLFDQGSGFLGSGSGLMMMNTTTTPNFNFNNNNNTNKELYLEMIHSREIDEYIRIQNERFRSALEEQRNKQMAEIERHALAMSTRKDHALAAASTRASELESLVLSLEAERQRLERVVRDQNDTVSSLSDALERLVDGGCHVSADAEDSGSCCGGGEEEEERNGGVLCRRCGEERACVVLLPCRHMCTCGACEPHVRSCPVCGSEKKASIEALIL